MCTCVYVGEAGGVWGDVQVSVMPMRPENAIRLARVRVTGRCDPLKVCVLGTEPSSSGRAVRVPTAEPSH